MKIEKASPEVARAAQRKICRQMASHLISDGTDLARPDRVTASLAGAGFGGESIAALKDEATRLARTVRQEAG